jgi:hypothetical protein
MTVSTKGNQIGEGVGLVMVDLPVLLETPEWSYMVYVKPLTVLSFVFFLGCVTTLAAIIIPFLGFSAAPVPILTVVG